MPEIASQLLNGLLIGSIYGMIAVGLTLIYGVLHLVNFAHGEYFMLGAFATWAAMSFLDLPYELSILFAIACSICLAIAISYLITERLVGRPFEIGVLATMGLSMIYQNGTQMGFGSSFKYFGGGWSEQVDIFGMPMTVQRLAIMGFMIAIFIALELLVRYSRPGKMMRAVSQNHEASLVVGIDVKRVVRYTFVVGIALAVFAGALMAPIVVSIYPQMGLSFTLRAFAIIAIGGLGNMMGAFLGALILGIGESMVAGFIGLGYRDAFVFIVLVAVLILRPHGLFGRTVRG